MTGDFYVGYQPKASEPARRWMRATTVALITAAAALALGLVLAQSPFTDSRFEFQVYKPYQGTYSATPYPALTTPSGTLLLVAPGKFGADSMLAVAGARGQTRDISLEGALIARGGDAMIEILEGTIQDRGPASRAATPPRTLGKVTLTGEIVDTKCHFGVMNPGSGKVHRDCAVRCLSGGIPPGLLVRDASGRAGTILLAGPDGGPIGRGLRDFVGEPVTFTGELVRIDAGLLLRTEPRPHRQE